MTLDEALQRVYAILNSGIITDSQDRKALKVAIVALASASEGERAMMLANLKLDWSD